MCHSVTLSSVQCYFSCDFLVTVTVILFYFVQLQLQLFFSVTIIAFAGRQFSTDGEHSLNVVALSNTPHCVQSFTLRIQ